MFAWYKSQGISLLDKLNAIYAEYGYCLNNTHSYAFDGAAGFEKMKGIMQSFRGEIKAFAGIPVLECLDYAKGLNGLPKSDVLKFRMEGNCSVVVRPSGTEPKLKAYISVSAPDREAAEKIEAAIAKDLEKYFA